MIFVRAFPNDLNLEELFHWFANLMRGSLKIQIFPKFELQKPDSVPLR